MSTIKNSFLTKNTLLQFLTFPSFRFDHINFSLFPSKISLMQQYAPTSKRQQSQDLDCPPPSLLQQDHMWRVIDLHFSGRSIVQHQLDSYNKFTRDIAEVIARHGSFEVRVTPQFDPNMEVTPECVWEFKFTGPVFKSPPSHTNVDKSTERVTPLLCRQRDLTYDCHIASDMEYRCYSVEENRRLLRQGRLKQVSIGKIPVMVGSEWCYLHAASRKKRIQFGECEFDEGGYFIVNGSEKVLISQEKQAPNYVFVFKQKTENQPWFAEIKSQAPIVGAVPIQFKLFLRLQKGKPKVLCRVKHMKRDMPLGLLLRALGLRSDEEIFQYVLDRGFDNVLTDFPHIQAFSEVLRASLEQVAFFTQGECLQVMGKFTDFQYKKTEEEQIDQAKRILMEKLLPHLGTDQGSFRKKAVLVSYMVRRLISSYVGHAQEDDRDHVGRKRLDAAGDLMLAIFSYDFKVAFIGQAKKFLQKKLTKAGSKDPNITTLIFDDRLITNSFRHAFNTGQWGKTKFGDVMRCGVSQTLKRDTTYFATLSHLRRVSYPMSSSSKSVKLRLLHNTHFGFFCPAETPQGQKIGVVKNLTLLSKLSIQLTPKQVEKVLTSIRQSKRATMYDINVNPRSQNQSKVVFNGDFIAYTTHASDFAQYMRELRRRCVFSDNVSISINYLNKEVRILTDAGRLMRPLLIVEKNRPRLNPQDFRKYTSFEALINNGFIEYVDIEQEQNLLIAMGTDFLLDAGTKKYTHLQIHPSMILGVCASAIPYANHNQATKNTLQSAMSKQAMGLIATNTNLRFQTTQHLHYYPQRPLAQTRSSKHVSLKDMPNGANPIVAMACFTGYNQEDSIIVNQSSIERGMFRSAFFRTYQAEQHLSALNNVESKITAPTNKENLSYDRNKIDSDGLAKPGTRLQGEEALIWKVQKSSSVFNATSMQQQKVVDSPVFARRGETGSVDRIAIAENSNGNKIAKVRVRSVRIPQIGDKFASRHGQKGTVGMAFRQEDLPFSLEGIVPDMIVNPHCIPSRMTVGHLIECLTSKIAALRGQFSQDGTAFTKEADIIEKGKELLTLGYQPYGNERMASPYTGVQYENLVFLGPIFYQRLRHLVDDKMYARSRGVVVALTRQPTHGRRKAGGLRFGEMERDCVISHGMADLLRERLFSVSDRFRVHVCVLCGLLAIAQAKQGRFHCQSCRNSTHIVAVDIPYAAKLMMQELMAMHIVPRLQFPQRRHKV